MIITDQRDTIITTRAEMGDASIVIVTYVDDVPIKRTAYDRFQIQACIDAQHAEQVKIWTECIHAHG